MVKVRAKADLYEKKLYKKGDVFSVELKRAKALGEMVEILQEEVSEKKEVTAPPKDKMVRDKKSK